MVRVKIDLFCKYFDITKIKLEKSIWVLIDLQIVLYKQSFLKKDVTQTGMYY